MRHPLQKIKDRIEENQARDQSTPVYLEKDWDIKIELPQDQKEPTGKKEDDLSNQNKVVKKLKVKSTEGRYARRASAREPEEEEREDNI